MFYPQICSGASDSCLVSINELNLPFKREETGSSWKGFALTRFQKSVIKGKEQISPSGKYNFASLNNTVLFLQMKII